MLGHCLHKRHNNSILNDYNKWLHKVNSYLTNAFPTLKESGQFLYTPGAGMSYKDMDIKVEEIVNGLTRNIKSLELILDNLTKYYEFEPDTKRLFVQNIDSFSKVRDINFKQVESFLKNGFIDISEKSIKDALLEIIGQSYIPKDWGGETEDIYSSFVLLNGSRVQTSMILKGSGTVPGNETRLGDLGKKGDQLERMMRTNSSKLYIVQSVKPIGQDIVNNIEAFVDQQIAKGNKCFYCLIDGQDTAMILYAYGVLK